MLPLIDMFFFRLGFWVVLSLCFLLHACLYNNEIIHSIPTLFKQAIFLKSSAIQKIHITERNHIFYCHFTFLKACMTVRNLICHCFHISFISMLGFRFISWNRPLPFTYLIFLVLPPLTNLDIYCLCRNLYLHHHLHYQVMFQIEHFMELQFWKPDEMSILNDDFEHEVLKFTYSSMWRSFVGA